MEMNIYNFNGMVREAGAYSTFSNGLENTIIHASNISENYD